MLIIPLTPAEAKAAKHVDDHDLDVLLTRLNLKRDIFLLQTSKGYIKDGFWGRKKIITTYRCLMQTLCENEYFIETFTIEGETEDFVTKNIMLAYLGGLSLGLSLKFQA